MRSPYNYRSYIFSIAKDVPLNIFALFFCIYGFLAITLKGAIEKSPILLSHYWKNGQLERTIIFRGININFAICISNWDWANNSFYKGVKFIKKIYEKFSP